MAVPQLRFDLCVEVFQGDGVAEPDSTLPVLIAGPPSLLFLEGKLRAQIAELPADNLMVAACVGTRDCDVEDVERLILASSFSISFFGVAPSSRAWPPSSGPWAHRAWLV